MKFDISLVKVTGSPGKSGWSQVHDFTPDDPEKFKARGRLIAVIAVPLQENGLDAISQGREVLTRLHEEYFGNLDKSAFDALKTSVDKVFNEFKETLGGIEISAVTIIKDVVYSAAVGGAQMSLIRDNMFARILLSKDNTSVSASGFPKEDDILILGTEQFFKSFDAESIKSTLEKRDLLEAQDTFASAKLSEDEKGMLGAAIIYFGGRELPTQLVHKKEEVPVEKEKPIKKIMESLKKITNKVGSTFSKPAPRKRIFVKKRMADLETVEAKKTYLSVGIILIFVLIISVGFGIKQKKENEARKLYEDKLLLAIHNYDEATNLSSISRERSRELISQSREIVDALTDQGVKDDRLEELKMKMDKAKEDILGEYKVEPQLFIDLSLLSSGFEIGRLAASSETIAVLSKSKDKVATVSVSNKKANIVSGPDDLKEIEDIAVYTDRIFALKGDGIYELGPKTEKVIEKDWNDGLIYAYAGNIYILNKEKNQIYRFPGTGTSFSSKQEWLVSEAKLDFSDVQNWVIDGNVWISYKDGTFSKLSQGSPQQFIPKGVYPSITNPSFIYTNEELENIYILEKDKNRIVVLKKNGEYHSQYISDKLKDADFVLASEKDKEIIFSGAEGRLYFIELRD